MALTSHIELLGRFPLSLILSFLTEEEGTSLLICRRLWARSLLPVFRLPSSKVGEITLASSPNFNRQSKQIKNRHKFLVFPVQDAVTRLDRLNTRRWKRQRLPCCDQNTSEYIRGLSQKKVHDGIRIASRLGSPPLLRFYAPEKDFESLFKPGTTMLASYPRSGNTLVRSLLESVTGFVTGSDTRPDRTLSLALAERHDLVGEGLVNKGAPHSPTPVVKTHWPERIGCKAYHAHRGVVLVRNPFDAIDSYWNLNVTNTHTAKVTDAVYREHAEFFHKLVLNEMQVWLNFLTFWHNRQHRSNADDTVEKIPLLWVRFEDLVSDPQRQLLRILEFSTNHDAAAWTERVNFVLRGSGYSHGYQNPSKARAQPCADSTENSSQSGPKTSIGRSLKLYPASLLKKIHELDTKGWLRQFGYDVIQQGFPQNVGRGEFASLSGVFDSDPASCLSMNRDGRVQINRPVGLDLRPRNCPYGRNMRAWRRKHTKDDSQPFPTKKKTPHR